MNKKEQAAFDDATNNLREARALRWSTPDGALIPPRRPPAPGGDTGVTTGWDTNVFTRSVTRGWSTCSAHGDGPPKPGSGSQKPIALYSTQSLALRALRVALERNCAAALAGIDDRIEEALAAETVQLGQALAAKAVHA